MATVKARCVATTGDTFCKSIGDCHNAWPNRGRRLDNYDNGQSNLFREAQFSGDGTTIVTQNEDHCLRTFVLPVDLLDESKQQHSLSAHCTLPSPSAIQSYAVYPNFDLQDPSTAVVLCASEDIPISLRNVLHYGNVQANYSLIDPKTEAYVALHSLAWTPDGTHFIAGSKNQISIFDATRGGSGPVSTSKTGPGRSEKRLLGSSNVEGCRGIVSALSISPDGFLAAGSTERQIGVYAHEGRGECVTAFAVTAQAGESDALKGTGITQLAWSPCGTYLLVAERQSHGVHVYDVRNTLRKVSWLSGRQANTTQRLRMDVFPTADGYEVWAGGTDGCVSMWKNAGSSAGEHIPAYVMEAHEDPVSSAVWHPRGAVLATCSGRRLLKQNNRTGSKASSASSEEESSSSSLDNTLKIWCT